MDLRKRLMVLGCVTAALLSGCGDTEVKRPYTEPEIQEGQALIWLREEQGGDYELLSCSEELSCTTWTYHFDNSPEGKERSEYFACVVTGLEPTDSGEIVLLFNNGSAPWDNVKKALIYDVAVSADGQVTVGEGEECQDFAVGWEFLKEPELQIPEDPYCYTTEDGSFFAVSGSYTAGTPYGAAGMLWDTQILAREVSSGTSGDDSLEGGSRADSTYYFLPQAQGETTIVEMETFFTENETTGYFYHITVDEEMRCRWDWYTSGVKDEDFKIYITIKDRAYLFP
ncbi:MAG: hypothetical protein NC337_14005 [Roseburia sp.]|nr:hypothetical protein [Roseburia sp.]